MDLDCLDCPVFVAYGDGTASALKTGVGRLAGHMDDVQVEAIEEAGHGFTLVKPEAFNDLLTEWLPANPVVEELD